jgi:hypothetical protein
MRPSNASISNGTALDQRPGASLRVTMSGTTGGSASSCMSAGFGGGKRVASSSRITLLGAQRGRDPTSWQAPRIALLP